MHYDDSHSYYDRLDEQRREDQRREDRQREQRQREDRQREDRQREARLREQQREERQREARLREMQREEEEEYKRRKQREIDSAIDEGRRTGDYSGFLLKIGRVPTAPPVGAPSAAPAAMEADPLFAQWARLRNTIATSSILPVSIASDWLALLDAMSLADRPGSLAHLLKITERYNSVLRLYRPPPGRRPNPDLQVPSQLTNEAGHIEAEVNRLRTMLQG